MNETAKRSITGLLLAGLMVTCILLHPFSFIALILVINLAGIHEFYMLHQPARTYKWIGMTLSLFTFLLTLLSISGICGLHYLSLIPVIGFIGMVLVTLRNKPGTFQSAMYIFSGLLFITLPSLLLVLTAFLPLQEFNYHSDRILGFVLMIWASDVGAYFTGKTMGRHALFSRVSPNKTWEGYAGGVLLTFITAFLVSKYFTAWSPAQWYCTALVIVTAGVAGDFVKSVMKRNLGVKDSGNILPGHGGILDRFDSTLSSAPFVFCIFSFWS